MKKILLLVIFACTLGTEVFGQYKGQYRVQSGNELNIQSGLFGINFSGEAFPFEYVAFVPSLTFLLPATGKATNLHLDARYYFTEDKFEFYTLLGYGLFRRRFEFSLEPAVRNVNSVNLGAGMLYKFTDELGINGEAKFQPQNDGEVIVRIGISYFIN